MFFARAFSNFLSKFNVPYMALPFNLVAVFVFLTLQPPQSQQAQQALEVLETEAELNKTLSWTDVGQGVIVSMGQVYAVNQLEPSLMMNLAVLLSSPVLFVMANIGAALGTLLSLSFTLRSIATHSWKFPASASVRGVWPHLKYLSFFY